MNIDSVPPTPEVQPEIVSPEINDKTPESETSQETLDHVSATPTTEEWVTVSNRKKLTFLFRVLLDAVPGKTKQQKRKLLMSLLDKAFITPSPAPYVKVFQELASGDTPPLSQGKAPYIPVEYFVFGTINNEQITLIQDTSLQYDNPNTGEVVEIPILEAPLNALQDEAERKIFVHLLHPNTTAHQVGYGVSKWGNVTNVQMGLNYTKTYAHATITFEKAESVEQMAGDNIYMIVAGHGTGIVKSWGTKDADIDKLHVKKLAHLPFNTSAQQLVNHLYGQDIRVKAVTLLRDHRTGQSQMAAKVFFEDTEDMENALMKRLIIDGKKSVWAESDARTCHECGSVGHFVKDCSARAKRRERRVYREFNSLPKRVQTAQIKAGFSFAAALKGNNPNPTVAPTQFVHQQADFPALQSGPTTKTKGKGVVRNGESSVQPNHVKTPTAENIREMVQQEVAG
ncbi:hypothetical protein BGW41_007663, partial [Actinomortierella wolfii]